MKQLPSFNSVHIVIIGDVMLDVYLQGNIKRISPEAPVPVVLEQETNTYAGGAANVAMNIAALGARVTLLGVCGQDWEAERLEQLLTAGGVKHHLIKVKNGQTITKQRIFGNQQQLLRLDRERPLSEHAAQSLTTALKKLLTPNQVVIISDYAKGTLHNCQQLIATINQAGARTIVDPKSNDFAKYQGAYLVTPNWQEFCQASRHNPNKENDFFAAGKKLLSKNNIQNLLITRGAAGMTLVSSEHYSDLPTVANRVADVTGAGDTVIATLAATLAAKCSLVDAIKIANTAAGIAVAKSGTAIVKKHELQNALNKNSSDKMIDLKLLQSLVRQAQLNGEKIVMTNGCFDLLHAGHVTYLRAAKELGNRLIVAINDDASTSRLKGSTRPINTLAHRITVLAELQSVDWIIAFSSDTPEDLISKLQPDYLVKGGDYADVSAVVGHSIVHSYGGQVKVLPAVAGLSSSKLLAANKAAQATENSN